MEPKKNPSIDVNNGTSSRLFFQIGLTLALLATFGLFSFKVYEKKKEKVKVTYDVDDIEMVEATEQEQKEEPPPVKQEVEVVDDDEVLEDTIPFKATEFKEDLKLKAKPKPKKKEKKKRKIFTIVEESAKFPGGDEAMYRFLANNLKFPEEASEAGVEGQVLIEVTIDERGKVEKVRPALPENLRQGYGLEEEAMRVIKLMPRFKPARQGAENVAVRFVYPVEFVLE